MTSVGLGFVPVVGTAKGIYEGFSGKDSITGDKLSGFDSAKFVYPGEEFSEVQGFSKADLDELMVHVKKTAPLALRFSKEDAGATV